MTTIGTEIETEITIGIETGVEVTLTETVTASLVARGTVQDPQDEIHIATVIIGAIGEVIGDVRDLQRGKKMYPLRRGK